MTSLAAAILDHQIFFVFKLNTENGEKTTNSDWNQQNCKSIVKLSVFRNFLAKIVTFFSENETFRSQHKSCVSYYDDVINHDVT